MRVSYGWLQDYVDIPWTVEQLADKMTMLGLMVETMEPLADGIGDVVVAEVLRLERHPNADELSIAVVSDGVSQRTVVTGAPNVAVGQKVALARPGVQLPGGQHIEAVSLRGVTSEGMLCSEAELGVGEDGSGIWVLPDDAVVGRFVVDALKLDDVVLHLEVYPNRPDCLSVIGVAREVAALLGQPVRLPDLTLEETRRRADEIVTVHIADEDLCARYTARVIENVTIGPSPAWLQQRLRVAGMRPINNVVDVTNFVMWEWGQPLHAFDLDEIEQDRIVVRRAKPKETIVTLDGTERALQQHMLVIADGARPVAVAGVMGGANSEVTEKTGRILLESANFDPVSVRRTAHHFGLRTEASHRFEKGLDPNVVPAAATRAAQLMQRLTGADVLAGSADVYPRPVTPWTVACRPARVRSLLGIDIEAQQIASYLRSLELDVQEQEAVADGDALQKESTFVVTVPTHRPDLREEADLIEEVARMFGYDKIDARLPQGIVQVAKQSEPLPFLDKVRELLVAAGLDECITYSFVDPRSADKLRLAADDERRKVIALRNPLKEEQSVMRTTLLGGLLETAARNRARRNTSVHLFEIGAVFLPESLPLQRLPKEARRVALLMTGTLPENNWGRKPAEASFYDVKGVVEGLLAGLRVETTFATADSPTLHPGRGADVFVEGKRCGIVGEVHPDVAEAYDLAGVRLYVAELDADLLAEVTSGVRLRSTRLPRFPAVERDIAVVVSKSVSAASVEAAIKEYGGRLLEQVRLFDVYAGAQVEQGHQSLAYALTLRSDERTLTDEEANEVMDDVERGLAERFGAKRRA